MKPPLHLIPTSWVKTLKRLQMPEALAFLDWSSGMIWVNATYSEFEAAANRPRPSEQERELLETLTHEQTHYMQICTTGYLYLFALELYDELSDCFSPRLGLGKLPSTVPAECRNRVTELLNRLVKPGPRNLTVTSIVESSAFLAQKRHHWPSLTHQRYQQMLAKMPSSSEYRQAYDVAVEYLGYKAFDLCPLIASLSLCTGSPPEAFDYLCRIMQALTRDDQAIQFPPDSVGDLLNSLPYKVVGYAPIAAHQRIEHPIYSPTVAHLWNLHRQGVFNFTMYMIEPYVISSHLSDLLRPALFYRKSQPPQLMLQTAFWEQGKRERHAFELLHLFLVSRYLAKNL